MMASNDSKTECTFFDQCLQFLSGSLFVEASQCYPMLPNFCSCTENESYVFSQQKGAYDKCKTICIGEIRFNPAICYL